MGVLNIKMYNEKYFEAIFLKVRDDPYIYPEGTFDSWQYKLNKSPDEEAGKLPNNIIRAKKRIFETVVCNDFEWWATLTLNKEKIERYGLEKAYSKISEFFNNYKRDNKNFIYLVVPEKHSDGAWHFHSFFGGVPPDHLYKFSVTDVLPVKILKLIKKGVEVFSWIPYSEKFGFSHFVRINNKIRAAKYATKYITKQSSKNVTEKGLHLYYCSKGLKKPTKLYSERYICDIVCDDKKSIFDSEYCKKITGEGIKTFRAIRE